MGNLFTRIDKWTKVCGIYLRESINGQNYARIYLRESINGQNYAESIYANQ